jgi:stress response protein SCP2
MQLDLEKGMSLDLSKQPGGLTTMDIGVTWGKQIIEKTSSGLFGIGSKTSTEEKDVDLDLSLFVYSDSGLIDKVYFNNKRIAGVVHSGDDLIGGVKSKDNETIRVDFNSLPAKATKLVAVLVSYNKVPFKELNTAELRTYDTSVNPRAVMTETKITTQTFGNASSMIFCKIELKDNSWVITAIGEPSSATSISEIETFARRA